MKRFIPKFGIIILLIFIASACAKNQSQNSQSTNSQSQIPVAQVTPTPTPTANYSTASGKKPQFVVLAFDGSYSLDMWQKTLDFSKAQSLKGAPAHFTYFLSGVYFLNYRKAAVYLPPDGHAGHSLIGFGDSNLDVEKRVAYVNRAIAEGHEIGSHLNGHFNGKNWTQANWTQEFNSFKNLVFSVPKNNNVSEADAARYTINLSPEQLIGYRAPELGHNQAMFDVLKEQGYAYDTSLVGKEGEWPKKLQNGLWEFPLASINYASSSARLLSMDYNFYFKQSKAKDVAKKGSPEWQEFYNDTYASYLNYFNNNYNSTRAPVFIGSHFSEWNDGAYWEAMRDFAARVCGQPEVRCVSFKELMGYLDAEQNN